MMDGPNGPAVQMTFRCSYSLMRETRQVVVALQHHFVRVGMLSLDTPEDATPNQGMTRWTSPR